MLNSEKRVQLVQFSGYINLAAKELGLKKEYGSQGKGSPEDMRKQEKQMTSIFFTL